ncbi:MAG: nuclear transport factor 2 family protein [Deltaproteobacteria bacterium]|nr:nuclear transport factor 2 family protein [Deltaproteobacteria bacterium]
MPLVPPFTENTAKAKVRRAQDLWNTKDPEKVALAYTEDTEWRNRNEFFIGRQAITAFLTRKWQKELDYRLKKEIFLFSVDKIAVQFEYEWHDAQGQWFRSYGLEHWEFAIDGLMKKRVSSINDLPIQTRTAPAKQVSLAATDPVKAI